MICLLHYFLHICRPVLPKINNWILTSVQPHRVTSGQFIETLHINEHSRSDLKFVCNFLNVVSGNACADPPCFDTDHDVFIRILFRFHTII